MTESERLRQLRPWIPGQFPRHAFRKIGDGSVLYPSDFPERMRIGENTLLLAEEDRAYINERMP